MVELEGYDKASGWYCAEPAGAQEDATVRAVRELQRLGWRGSMEELCGLTRWTGASHMLGRHIRAHGVLIDETGSKCGPTSRKEYQLVIRARPRRSLPALPWHRVGQALDSTSPGGVPLTFTLAGLALPSSSAPDCPARGDRQGRGPSVVSCLRAPASSRPVPETTTRRTVAAAGQRRDSCSHAIRRVEPVAAHAEFRDHRRFRQPGLRGSTR